MVEQGLVFRTRIRVLDFCFRRGVQDGRFVFSFPFDSEWSGRLKFSPGLSGSGLVESLWFRKRVGEILVW